MAKHNQPKTIGTLTDFQTAPEPTPETTDERIDWLERQLLQVQTILNDVMQQLDAPYREKPRSNGMPKQAKPKQANPKQTKPKQAKPSKPKTKKKAPTPPAPATTEEQKQADNAAVIAFLHQHPDKLWHGRKLRFAIKEYCDLSNRRITSAVKHIRKTGHLVVIKDVEVDGERLEGAFQFVPQPEPTD